MNRQDQVHGQSSEIKTWVNIHCTSGTECFTNTSSNRLYIISEILKGTIRICFLLVLQGSRLQPLQKPHYLGQQQGMDSLWLHHKSETDARVSEHRSGWLSRPGSVLAEDPPDFFSHTPREQGDLKPVKSGRSRLQGDYRLNRD